MGSVLRSQTCHYCGKSANTEDHIVPRCDLPRMATLPYWFRELDVVPACKKCNGDKGPMKSDCDCRQCIAAWAVAVKHYLPPGYTPRGYIKMQRNQSRVG
jgi:hypothetical protein